MSEVSALPSVHNILSQIPFPGPTWQEVITTLPRIDHLYWSFLFLILCSLLQIICWVITKMFAPLCLSHASPPKVVGDYKLLTETTNAEMLSNINKYSDSDLAKISAKYCDNQLNASETRKYLKSTKRYMEYAKNEKKFEECLFPLFSKLIGFSFAIYAFYDKDWIYNGSLFWIGLPSDPYRQNMDKIPDIKLLYVMHIGWYFYKLFATVYIDRRLNDFVASMVHHTATAVLLIGSYYGWFVRVGVTILMLHDPADIVLQTGKLFRLCKQSIMTNIAFGLLVIVWFFTRIVIFPYHCILSAGLFVRDTGSRSAGALCIFAVVLYVLHLHWFQLIIRAVIRVVKGGKVADVRDKDDLDEDENSPNPNAEE